MSCKFYFSPRGCKRGDTCRFSHDRSSLPAGRPRCTFDPGAGRGRGRGRGGSGCRLGAACRFRHASDEAGSDSEEDPHEAVPEPEPEGCVVRAQALAFLKDLEVAPTYLESKFSRCYCAHCWREALPDVLKDGPSPYVIPKGWYRFGLKLPPKARPPAPRPPPRLTERAARALS